MLIFPTVHQSARRDISHTFFHGLNKSLAVSTHPRLGLFGLLASKRFILLQKLEHKNVGTCTGTSHLEQIGLLASGRSLAYGVFVHFGVSLQLFELGTRRFLSK